MPSHRYVEQQREASIVSCCSVGVSWHCLRTDVFQIIVVIYQ